MPDRAQADPQAAAQPEPPTFPDVNVISFTKVDLAYGWLGNMSSEYGTIEYDGKRYKTAEHLYQTLRYPADLCLPYKGEGLVNVRELISKQAAPLAAARIARRNDFKDHRCVEPRSSTELDLMMMVLRLKMNQAPGDMIRRKLIKMGLDAVIVEDTTSHPKPDTYWGAYRVDENTWKGFSHLGQLWMALKAEVIAAQAG